MLLLAGAFDAAINKRALQKVFSDLASQYSATSLSGMKRSECKGRASLAGESGAAVGQCLIARLDPES